MEVEENTVQEEKDEFDYDEDGNIIIPEAEFDDEDGEDDEELAFDEDDEDTAEDDITADDVDEDEADEVDEADQKSDKDEKSSELQKKYDKLVAQCKDTLSKLDVKSEDVMAGLEKLAADAEDVPVEEYKKKREAEEKEKEASRAVQNVEFEKKMKNDLSEIQAAFPETRKYKSLVEIENLTGFGRFRDLGLSAKEAYAAANPDSIRQNVAKAVKQQSLNSSKSHLKSAVPKNASDNSVNMTKRELTEWRDLFPNKSDKEILALYRSSLKK